MLVCKYFYFSLNPNIEFLVIHFIHVAEHILNTNTFQAKVQFEMKLFRFIAEIFLDGNYIST